MATSSSYRRTPRITLGQDNNALVLLFAANMIMFVALHIISMIYQLSDIPMDFFQAQVLDKLTLPASAEIFFSKPWTLLMYMVTHYSFWHLVSSMLWLWCFGFIMQDLAGNNKLIPAYLYGGFIGGICFLLAANLLPGGAPLNPMLGASAAVMSVAIATTALAPNYRIFPLVGSGIPLWVVALIFVAIDFGTLGKGNAAIASAHLGAGLTGFLFTHQLKRGRDWSAWMNQLVDWFNNLFNPEKKNRGAAARDRLYYQSDRKPFEKKANVTQQKLDDILDKINQKGYDRLTDEEKDFLKRASKEEL